jgi:leucyl-tRNA synthetase
VAPGALGTFGGKREIEDQDGLACAIREIHEETEHVLTRDQLNFVGIYPSQSNPSKYNVVYKVTGIDEKALKIHEGVMEKPMTQDEISAHPKLTMLLERWLMTEKGEYNAAFVEEGDLVNSGDFSGKSSQEARPAITKWLEEKGTGRPRVTYRLRDWVFSRQRYWGEPIPLVHCENGCGAEHGGWVPLPESELPLTLPVVEKYEPTDNGDSPLASVPTWVNTKCPQCGGAATRETDTMPNWAGSSWYFLRYIDPKNNEQFASKEKLDYWMPVDWYNGGMEHTTLHLLYSRFWHKFLFDRGYLSMSEPYAKRTSHGLIMAEDGNKMSKSKGNVVNPDDIVQEHGADTVRVYELFMGPFSEPVPWSTAGVIGVRRFLDRVIKLSEFVKVEEPIEVTKSVHKTIHSVIDAAEAMKFNTAVASLMSCVNDIGSAKAITKETLTKFLSVLGWFAPHVANEVYAAIGGEELVETLPLPTIDTNLLTDDTVTISVQVNGKMRAAINVASDASEEEIIAAARAHENVAKYVEGEPKKVIYIKGKIVSIVV